MALDAALLALTARELSKVLLDAKIDKIFEPTRDEVVVTLRTRTETHKLLLSARSGSARACLTHESFENPQTPPSFCMLLRKHLTGGRLVELKVEPGDRLAFFTFQCTNEMGDLVRNTLAVELMGRYSNLVLVQDGRIIDALKRVDFEDSEIRQLLPGLPYTLPQKPAKPDLFAVSSTGLVAAACQKDLPVADALMRSCSGVGPVVCREIAFRALGEGAFQADSLTDAQKSALTGVIEQVQQEFAQGGTPWLAADETGKPVEFSFLPLTQYGEGRLRSFDSYSQMLEGYYSQKDRAERLRQKSKDLAKTVRNLHDRAIRKQAARREELQQTGKADTLRLYGELLQANLWAVEKGAKSVTVTNYYDGQPVQIPLDVRLNASANAQKYFKEYKKKQTAARMLAKLLEEGEREIAYLATVLYEVETATGEQALGEIRAELKSQGYLKYYKIRDKKQKPADFYRYRSSDGFLILVGRNNLQNDKLTLHTARGKDMWFHVKDAPGSHTVVMSEGRDIPLSTQNEAAMLAVVHSSLNGGAKVPVDYTEVRNIRKTGDLKPGMVLYEKYETGYVTPEPGIEERLKESGSHNG
ncbi:NFACT family protein [uncultured Allofournierella sp.]|uniref:Rqc2 family fibronectin-binding protein n=1 Tax=uncultured Allofournierella sp. TaxID=1940258 RepID=UPI0037536161